jgi:hypothetical protein
MKKNLLIVLMMCLMVTSQLFAQTITSFTPTSGKAGASITINGTGLSGTNVVKFGAADAASFVVNGAGTQITAVLGTKGDSGYIFVKNASGQAYGYGTNGDGFQYQPNNANALSVGDVVINKVFNNATGGIGDAVEVLVVKNGSDLRGLYLKDFQPGKSGGATIFFFADVPHLE